MLIFKGGTRLTRIILAIAALLILFGVAWHTFASDVPLEQWSSYEWSSMSRDQQTYFLAGLLGGLWYGAKGSASTEPEVKAFFATLARTLDTVTLNEACRIIDAVYDDPSLRSLPITGALITPYVSKP